MFIKECTYIEHIKEGKETLYIVFIKNPNLNIKKSSEKSQTINDVCYNVCSRNINTSYIQSCHQNKKSTMIIVTQKILKNETGFDIENILQRFDGNRALAAAHLGISRTTLWRRLKSGQ